MQLHTLAEPTRPRLLIGHRGLIIAWRHTSLTIGRP